MWNFSNNSDELLQVQKNSYERICIIWKILEQNFLKILEQNFLQNAKYVHESLRR